MKSRAEEVKKNMAENLELHLQGGVKEKTEDVGIKPGEKGSKENPIKNATELINLAKENPDILSTESAAEKAPMPINDCSKQARINDLMPYTWLLKKGSIGRYVVQRRIIGWGHEQIAAKTGYNLKDIKTIERQAVLAISDQLTKRKESGLVILDEFYRAKQI